MTYPTTSDSHPPRTRKQTPKDLRLRSRSLHGRKLLTLLALALALIATTVTPAGAQGGSSGSTQGQDVALVTPYIFVLPPPLVEQAKQNASQNAQSGTAETACDVTGIVNPIGDACALALALKRSDYWDAGFALVGFVPGLGDGVKWGYKGAKKVFASIGSWFRKLRVPAKFKQLRGWEEIAEIDRAVKYPRKPSTRFSGLAGTDSRYTYFTDAHGRTSVVSGKLSAVPARGRSTGVEASIREAVGRNGDEAGHIVAGGLGGSGMPYNIVPQSKIANDLQNDLFENKIFQKLGNNRTVEIHVELKYSDMSYRPSYIDYYWKVDNSNYWRSQRIYN